MIRARFQILVLLSALSGTAALQAETGDVGGFGTPQGVRGVLLAIIGFDVREGGDARDAWIPVALEELMARRLRCLPKFAPVPTMRLYQARRELTEPGGAAPAWPIVARGMGARYLLSGDCHGPDTAVTVELHLSDLAASPAEEARVRLPEGRLFDVLDAATRWLLEQLAVGELDAEVAKRVFEVPSRSTSVVEYYARAISAGREGDSRDALLYGSEALQRDRRFRPALAVLAQIEAQLGPSGRGTAWRRLVMWSELARAAADPHDRVRAEIGQSLLLQADGAFDAAYTRAENALAIAYEHCDLYGQAAAITAICDSYLLRPLPIKPTLSDEERLRFAKENGQRAAEWQAVLVDLLLEAGDLVAALPALDKAALIYERLQQPELALQSHRKALEMGKRLGSRPHQATAWLYLGQWYRRQGRWAEALEAINACLDLAAEGTKPTVRFALGGVYQAMGSADEALTQYELAYDQVRRSDDLQAQFECLREIALMRRELGRREKAITALRDAIDIAHALSLPDAERLRKELEDWQRDEP